MDESFSEPLFRMTDMKAHVINGPALPMSIYVVTAACCWLAPSRLTDGDGVAIINTYPTHAFALASAALVAVHLALSLRGRLALAVAGIWAVATISTVTMFALRLWVPWAVWSVFELAGAGLVAAAGALCVLAWQVARWRPLPDKHPIARAVVALGLVLLAICYATMALRVLLRWPEGLAQMAEVAADLTVSLWIASAVLLFGAAIHAVLPRRGHLNAA